jgi:hypothetical protein
MFGIIILHGIKVSGNRFGTGMWVLPTLCISSGGRACSVGFHKVYFSLIFCGAAYFNNFRRVPLWFNKVV